MRCGAAASTTASPDLAGCSGSFDLRRNLIYSENCQSSVNGANSGGEMTMRTGNHASTMRVFVAMLALLLVGWRPAAAQEPIAFKAGISDPVNTVLAWYMARDAGFYAAQGLKVDIVNMNGGSRGSAELQAGRLDVMHVGLSSVIRVNRSGGDIRTIGSLSNVIRFTFFSAPGVKGAADL